MYCPFTFILWCSFIKIVIYNCLMENTNNNKSIIIIIIIIMLPL